MTEIIYSLCVLASGTCFVLLFRGYQKTHVKLLFWSSLCFLGMTLNNALVFADLVLIPSRDFSLLRAAILTSSVMVQTYGFIWEAK